MPLEVGAGEVVAKLAAEEGVSALLDLSLFRKHEVATFMSSFLENLYRLKAREKFRTPLMLMIDEADAIAPQKPMKGEERMLGAAEDIVRRGGQRGLGCTLITQRSAVLNKNVLTQTQMLIVLRTIAPQDRKAIDEWIDVHGTPEERKTLMDSIASLPVGDAWFWSPGWPTNDGIFKRTHVLPIETFDSGATPKPGEKRREPKNLADVDLDALQRQMSETIERAQADDPKRLKARIRELEKVTNRQTAKTVEKAVPDQAAIDKSVQRAVKDRDRHWQAEVAKVQRELQARNRTLQRIERDARGIVERAHLNGDAAVEIADPPAVHRSVRNRQQTSPHAVAQSVRETRSASEAGSLGKGEAAILNAIAQHNDGVTREQLTVLTGYKRSSRDTYLQRLRSSGLIQDGPTITATDDGVDALGGDFETLPTSVELQEYWLNRLGGGEREILRVLVEIHPETMNRDDLTDVTGYKRSSRDTYLQRLKSRKLVIDEGRGMVRASDQLF